MAQQYSEKNKKILLLLLAGVALGFSASPRGYFKTLNSLHKEWQKMNQTELKRRIRRIYEDRLVEFKEDKNGLITVILTKKGERLAKIYDMDNMKIDRPKIWDGKWRIVCFDIPEKYKEARNALRYHLKQLGFIQLQKSVFCFPFECKQEIDFIIDFYQIRRWVRFLTCDFIDNELHLKSKFNLL